MTESHLTARSDRQLCGTPSGRHSTSLWTKESPRLDPKGPRDSEDIVEGDIALGPLDRPDIGSVQAARVRKRFLTEAMPLPQPPHVFGDSLSER